MTTHNDHNTVVFARDDLVQPYNAQEISFLQRRKGGGGGGGGRSSGGGVSSSSGSSSSSSSGSSSSGSRSSSSGSSSSSGGTSSGASKGFSSGSVSGGNRVYGSSSGLGIPNRYSITSGSFAGRQAGGGTRSNVYGSPYYGSGYTSGYNGRGAYAGGPVGGLGFPFIFWPVAFGGAGYGYYGSRELSDNAGDRPGGNMTQYTLTPPSTVTNATANMFALYGDANSVDAVFQAVKASCGVSNTLAANYTLDPNQAVQYFRGSSFALMLQGYNNTQPIDLNGDQSGNTTEATVATPAPPITSVVGVDTNYFNCLNSTTGNNVPLLQETDGAMSLHAASSAVLLLPALLIALLMNLFA